MLSSHGSSASTPSASAGGSAAFQRPEPEPRPERPSDGAIFKNAVIDAVGKPELINAGLPLLKRGGSFCVYGFYAGLKEFSVGNSLADFNYNIFVHQWPTRLYEKEAQRPLCDWVREGKLSGGEFITHRFAIDDIADALEAVRGRKVIKALLGYS